MITKASESMGIGRHRNKMPSLISPAMRSSKPFSMWARLLMVAVSLPLMGNSCPLTPDPAPRVLKISVVSVDKARYSPGETVTIQWEYENGDLLKSQTVRFLSLTLQGIVSSSSSLPTTARSGTLTFSGPVTIELTAESTTSERDSVAFDLKLDRAYSFTAKLSSVVGNTAYPRLGYANSHNSREVSFSSFVGFFDPDDRGTGGQAPNGEIDQFARNPVAAALFPRGTAFRGFSLSTQESQHFGLVQGRSYPILANNFLLSPDGVQFLSKQVQADAMIFGGAIGYDGEIVDIKSGSPIEGRRRVNQYEPIFLAVAFRSNDAGALYVSEIQLGNLAQGLVTTLYAGDSLLLDANHARYLSQPSGSYAGTPGHLAFTGAILEAQVGFPVTTTGGVFFNSYVQLAKVAWNMPFVPDYDVSLTAELLRPVP